MMKFFYDLNTKTTSIRFLSTLWDPNNSQNKILDETWCHLYVWFRVIFNGEEGVMFCGGLHLFIITMNDPKLFIQRFFIF